MADKTLVDTWKALLSGRVYQKPLHSSIPTKSNITISANLELKHEDPDAHKKQNTLAEMTVAQRLRSGVCATRRDRRQFGTGIMINRFINANMVPILIPLTYGDMRSDYFLITWEHEPNALFNSTIHSIFWFFDPAVEGQNMSFMSWFSYIKFIICYSFILLQLILICIVDCIWKWIWMEKASRVSRCANICYKAISIKTNRVLLEKNHCTVQQVKAQACTLIATENAIYWSVIKTKENQEKWIFKNFDKCKINHWIK